MMPLLPPQQKRVCATDAAIATQRCRTREGEQTHLHPLVNLRERVARHALRLDVLRTLREREELLIVAKRLLEVLEVGELLVGLTELVLRLALLGGVATRARSRKALFAGFQRRGRLTSRLALCGLRLVGDNEVLIGLLRASDVARALREPQQLLVLLDGGEKVARRLVRHAERARRLRLTGRVRCQLRDLEALFPKVDGRPLIGEAGEEVGELAVRAEDGLRVAAPPRHLCLCELRLHQRQHRRRDADLLLNLIIGRLDLGAVGEVEEVDKGLHVPTHQDVDAQRLLVERHGAPWERESTLLLERRCQRRTSERFLALPGAARLQASLLTSSRPQCSVLTCCIRMSCCARCGRPASE